MDKKLTLKIAGNDLVLNLGVNWFYEYFQEVTGRDLIRESLEALKESVKNHKERVEINIDSKYIFDYAKGFLYGGYMAECMVNKEKPKFSAEDISYMVMSSDLETVSGIVADCNNIRNTDEKNVKPQAAKSQKKK